MKPFAKCGCRFALVKLSIVGIAITVNSGAMIAPAFSAGWSINSSVSERLAFDDNAALVESNADPRYGTLTSFNVNSAWRGRRWGMKFKSGLNLRKDFGPGANSSRHRFTQSHKVDLTRSGKKTNFGLSSSFVSQDTTFSELDDTGIVAENKNNRLTYSVGGNVTHKVNRKTKVNFSSTAKMVDFTVSSPTLTPFVDVDLGGNLTRSLSKNMDAVFSVSLGYFKADNAINRTSYSSRFSGTLKTRLSPRLTLNIKTGVSIINTVDDVGLAGNTSSTTTIAPLADINLIYKLKTTQFSLSASQNFESSAAGELRQRTRVGFNVLRQVNRHMSIGLDVNGRRSTGQSSLTISPTYSYILARRWTANLGYIFRYRKLAGISATSNTAFVSLTRSISLLP